VRGKPILLDKNGKQENAFNNPIEALAFGIQQLQGQLNELEGRTKVRDYALMKVLQKEMPDIHKMIMEETVIKVTFDLKKLELISKGNNDFKSEAAIRKLLANNLKLWKKQGLGGAYKVGVKQFEDYKNGTHFLEDV